MIVQAQIVRLVFLDRDLDPDLQGEDFAKGLEVGGFAVHEHAVEVEDDGLKHGEEYQRRLGLRLFGPGG